MNDPVAIEDAGISKVRRPIALIGLIVLSAVAATTAAGCGRDTVPVRREARVLARTCGSLLQRSTGTVPAGTIPAEPFAEPLRAKPGRHGDRTELAAVVEACRRFAPPSPSVPPLVIGSRPPP